MQSIIKTLTFLACFYVIQTVVEAAASTIASTTNVRFSPWWKEVIAGAIAGQIEVICTYPLDVLKTKAMLVGENRSMTTVLSEIIAKNGVSGLFRGLYAPMLCALPWRATKNMSFSQYKRLLTSGNPNNATLMINIAAGVGVGITESIILTPFEVVKISMIADQSRLEKMYKDSFDCTRKIYKSEGILGFFRGYLATCYRQILFSTTYFITYMYCKEYIIPSVLASVLVSTNVSISSFNHMNHLVSGLLAGIFGSLVNTPLDVVKTILQQEQMGNSIGKSKIKSPMQGVIQLYRSKGFKALYAGLLPKIMRTGPGAAISFCIYEYMLGLLG